MQYHKVEICGVNTAKLPVLKEKEKIELIRKAQAGDQDARQAMIQGNLRLVLSVVQKFASRGESMDDLFQVGCIGLIKAIDHFNPELGLRFSTYGQPMILGEIRRFLRDNNSMRVSRSVRDMAYHAMQTREQLQKELGRDPTIQELSARMEQPQSAVTLALESVMDPLSLYEPVYNDGGLSLIHIFFGNSLKARVRFRTICITKKARRLKTRRTGMQTITKGLVLRATKTNEADRVLDVYKRQAKKCSGRFS